MTDLPVARRAAVVALLERCPDGMLRDLAVGMRTMPGARARAVQMLVEAEQAGRKVRAHAFGAVDPLFRPRPDGVEARTFPPVLAREIWRRLKAAQPALIDRAAPSCTTPEPPVAALDQICAAAANLLRDDAPGLWPSDPDLCLEAARIFDLAPLARRALPSLPAWTGRVTEEAAVELRLLMRDAAEVAPDGAPRIIEILFANISHAPLILRVLSHTSGSASDESFLAGSELADFGERLFRAAEARAARFADFDPLVHDANDASAAARDAELAAELLDELGMTLDLTPQGAWGSRAQTLRSGVTRRLETLVGAAEKLVDKALPLERVQTSGRMTRMAPRMDARADAPAARQARAVMAIFGEVRALAPAFGVGSKRNAVSETLSRRLGAYGDEVLEAINAGSAADPDNLIALVRLCADCVEGAGDETTARALRRRVAAAEAADISQDAA